MRGNAKASKDLRVLSSEEFSFLFHRLCLADLLKLYCRSKLVPQVGYVSSLLLGNRNMLYSHISVLVSFFSQESANLPHKLQNNAELAPRKSFTERGGSRATRASLCSHQTRYGLKVECTGNGPWKFGAGQLCKKEFYPLPYPSPHQVSKVNNL